MVENSRTAIAGKKDRMKYLTYLFFAIVFLIATNVRADIVFQGTMKPTCSEAVRYKTPARSIANSITNSRMPMPKEVTYLNLAQALARAYDSRPQPSGSVPARGIYPISTSTVARPFR